MSYSAYWRRMYDVAIVGGVRPVVVDADAGMTRRDINSHLGFPEGVRGADLVDIGKMQAARADGTGHAEQGRMGPVGDPRSS